MLDNASTLGQRIVEAAQLATALHLRQDQLDSMRRQQQASGGAGLGLTREGPLPAHHDRPRRSSPFSLSAEGEAA